jgi:hypothetical protein
MTTILYLLLAMASILVCMAQKNTDPSSASVVWLIGCRGHAQSMQRTLINEKERDRERGVGVSSDLHYVVLVVAVSWKQCTERERERERGIFRRYEGTRNL